MGVPAGTKGVTYFFHPDLIRDVKIEAVASGRTQSDVVADALKRYLAAEAKPRRSGRHAEASIA